MKTHLLSTILVFSTCLLQAQTDLIGYSAGISVICDCPVGYVAVGYRGGSGAWMDRLDIICKRLNADRTLNNALIYTNSVGATASEGNGTITSGDIIASGSMALTGVSATTNLYTSFGNYLSSIQGIVTPISSIANSSTSGTTTLPQFGPTGIALGSYSVPPGNAVTGIEGFTVNSGNNYVGGIKLRYKTIAEITATTSVSNGNWSNPNTWSNQTIPTNNTDVLITKQVTVDINAVCSSIKVQPTSNLTVNPGMNLNITSINANRPIAGFDFTTSNLEVLPVTLTTTNTTIGSNLTYTWSFGNGTSTQANPIINFTAGGIYNIKLVATNSSGSDSITKQIRISPYPQAYTNFNGVAMNLFAWEGNKVMILSRDNSLNRVTMFKWLKAMDTTYGYYKNCTGREPSINPRTYINNRTTIADVTTTCGAGCGYLGATGIELQNTYFDVMYNAINNNNQYDQAVFYEFGRNFWFYGNKLAYQTNDPTTTGYAVFMRFMAMEAAGVNGAPFGSWTFPTFRTNVENLINTYLADASLNWANTLGIGQGVPGSGLGATDLFASFCFRLIRDYGGENFVQNVWKQAGLRPNASTTQDAVDNFFLASCAAANRNLTTLFQSWKWTLSATAITAASQYP